MSYNYQTQRENLFTEEGQRLFIAYRDQAKVLLETAGAFMSGKLSLPKGIGAADGWDLLACSDRMIELGEMVELTGPSVWAQHRVFTTPQKDLR